MAPLVPFLEHLIHCCLTGEEIVSVCLLQESGQLHLSHLFISWALTASVTM